MDLWTKVLQKISQKLSKPSFETWFADTKAEITDCILTIKVKNEFTADWLEQRYPTLIGETIKEITGQVYEIVFTSPDQGKKRVHSDQVEPNDHHLEELVAHLEEQIKELTDVVEKQEERIKTLEKMILGEQQNDHPDQ